MGEPFATYRDGGIFRRGVYTEAVLARSLRDGFRADAERRDWFARPAAEYARQLDEALVQYEAAQAEVAR